MEVEILMISIHTRPVSDQLKLQSLFRISEMVAYESFDCIVKGLYCYLALNLHFSQRITDIILLC